MEYGASPIISDTPSDASIIPSATAPGADVIAPADAAVSSAPTETAVAPAVVSANRAWNLSLLTIFLVFGLPYNIPANADIPTSLTR